MERVTNKIDLLQRIHSLEKENFEYDENAILNEYKIQEENTSSIAIKILSILGGFLAMLTFLGFLLIAGLYNSEIGLTIFGITFILSAVLLNKKFERLIIDTFSVTMYILGFVLFYFGLTDLKVDENTIIIGVSIVAASSLFITQNYILSFISVLIISASFLTLIISNHQYFFIHLYIAVYSIITTYIFISEATLISSGKKLSKLYNPIRIGSVFSFLFGLIVVGKKKLIPIFENDLWLSSVAIILAILYLISLIIKTNEVEQIKNKILIYLFSTLILASTLFSPSISGAMLLILISFLVNYKTGLIIGIISFIYFISQYYYDLNLTLLTKSMLLFSSGIAFLLFYIFTSKKLASNEKI